MDEPDTSRWLVCFEDGKSFDSASFKQVQTQESAKTLFKLIQLDYEEEGEISYQPPSAYGRTFPAQETLLKQCDAKHIAIWRVQLGTLVHWLLCFHDGDIISTHKRRKDALALFERILHFLS